MVDGLWCERPTFTDITFKQAQLARSNLGGLGGRCDPGSSDGGSLLCTDGATTSATAHEVYISNVGKSADGALLDLRITNESEYRAWNVAINGIKRVQRVSTSGYFSVINLLAPRSQSQRRYWHHEQTFVDLRYTFLNAVTQAPSVLDRTMLTFYDFDAGRETDASGRRVSTECMIIRGAGRVATNADTEIVNQPPLATAAIASGLRGWDDGAWASETYYCGTVYGIGADNPADPLELSALEMRRSVLVELVSASSLFVRYAVYVCCGTGRNFLMAGFSNVVRPRCPSPPPPPSPPAPPGLPPRPPPFPPEVTDETCREILHERCELNVTKC